MASDIDSEAAQLLDQAPDFGAAGADFFGDFCSARDHGRVIHQEANDAAQAHVGGLVGAGRAANFFRDGDGGIIAFPSFVLRPWSLVPRPSPYGTKSASFLALESSQKRCVRETAECRNRRIAKGQGPRTTDAHAGMTLMLKSTAVADCVSAPTEIKSTPVSA